MNITSGEVVAAYFDLLSNEEIKKLYKSYENDFLLFNYQFEFREMKFNIPLQEPPPAPPRNSAPLIFLNIWSFVLIKIL